MTSPQSTSYIITDGDFEDGFKTDRAAAEAVADYAGDIRVYRVEGPNGRRVDVTRELALTWWENWCECHLSPVPDGFAPYLEDEVHAAKDRADDPRGGYVRADAYRDAMEAM
jgi:hypothetical protein